MKELELQNVYNKCLLDNDQYELLKNIEWSLGRNGRIRGNLSGKECYIHRVILNVNNSKLVVDHIDGNTFNNQKSNLRICTQEFNCRNKKMNSRNTSNYKGVYNSNNKFRAVIGHENKNIHLGYFETPEEASKAYDIAAKKYHGEFSSTNLQIQERKQIDVIYKPTKFDDPSLKPGMIPLGNEKYAHVDLDDYEKVMNHGWCLDQNGYAIAFINNRTTRLHRFIMKARANEIIDHIDRNRLNCTKNNLRRCSKQENRYNRTKNKNTSSKFKGVSFDKETKKWKCRINFEGKTKQLGRFKSEIEAAQAYNEAAIKYHKEFASLNDIIQ